jgi:phenylpropionate dioxygenase-like ring-hydroxylating dioxygenase large terminal subunit
MEAAISPHEAEDGVSDLLRQGLRNFWYVVARSEDLQAKPKAIKCLGEDLVLWRDSTGKPHLFQDVCPHRCARLSLGQIHGNVLQCWYHGIQLDTEGKCRLIPTEGENSTRSKQLSVRSYPTEEKAGLIWSYIGELEKFPPSELRTPEELMSDEWTAFVLPVTWKINWLLFMDNLADPLHAPFLHARSYTLSRGMQQDRIKSTPTAYGLFVERESQRLVNFDYIEMHFPNWVRLDIPYPRTAGPGGPLHVLVFATPVDEESSIFYFIRMRQVKGWKRNLWHFLWWLFLERMAWNVIEQDRTIIESQRGLIARRREHLVQADLGVLHFRRLLNDEAARQKAIYDTPSDILHNIQAAG